MQEKIHFKDVRIHHRIGLLKNIYSKEWFSLCSSSLMNKHRSNMYRRLLQAFRYWKKNNSTDV